MLCYVIINLKHWPGLAGFYENEPVNEVRFYSYNHQACMDRARYGRHYLLFIACAITLHYITTLLAVQFCSVLQPSSIRGLATSWTYFLHLSLSSVILTDSSTDSPAVHVLMLSVQAVRGLPRLRAPGIVPCIISFSRQLPCFLMV